MKDLPLIDLIQVTCEIQVIPGLKLVQKPFLFLFPFYCRFFEIVIEG